MACFEKSPVCERFTAYGAELGELLFMSLICDSESEPAKVREVSGVPVWERSQLAYESWKKRVEKGMKN